MKRGPHPLCALSRGTPARAGRSRGAKRRSARADAGPGAQIRPAFGIVAAGAGHGLGAARPY